MIDFTKPLRCKITKLKVNIIYSDEIGCLIRYNKNTHFFRDSEIEEHYENIPEEPRKIKGFIGVFINGDSTIMKPTVEELKKRYFNTYANFIAIVEINATEGEGLQ
jgi:hypothetical protein